MTCFRKKMKNGSMMIMAVLAIVVVGILAVGSMDTEAKGWKHKLSQTDDLKYSEQIVEGVFKSLRKQEKGPLDFSEALEEINTMSKVEVMDTYLGQNNKNVKPDEIRHVIQQIYDIDLEAISELGVGKQTNTYSDDVLQKVKQASNQAATAEEIRAMSKIEVMDLYWKAFEGKMTGEDIRMMINAIYGVNLQGISDLEDTGVSLYSKEQWISQYDKDLFVVQTGADDVDVWVYPTEYLKEQAGIENNPRSLEMALTKLGFDYNKEVDALYYSNPTGESVPDNFKGQTLGTIIGVIQEEYAHLK
ncbi:hypothetical protein SAMN04487936_10739 [Halobacillus dabanensis]|uniref:Uncharacterized protein n=1 Tax=Halobacillus dabanensis TaxID=240302 RepID=A0A1I3WND0_HALDA|nr:hypothetical protein [Halobacillus dabanensis]SFK08679.1 hypothetical protein SAMN04487936_10739 [Halobacillus dabanensis]